MMTLLGLVKYKNPQKSKNTKKEKSVKNVYVYWLSETFELDDHNKYERLLIKWRVF